MSNIPPFDFNNLNMEEMLGGDFAENFKNLDSRLAKEKITVETGGGLVKVTATANLRIKSVVLDDALIKMDDKEMTEDLITAAVNLAIEKSKEKAQEVTMEMLGPLGMMLQNSPLSPFGGR